MALVWETNSSLFDYWRPVFNQFSKIFPIETILDFFKKKNKKQKLGNHGQDILRQNQAEICLDFSSQCCKEKKLGLAAKRSPYHRVEEWRGVKIWYLPQNLCPRL